MTSLQAAMTTSFNLPQHRMLEESTYSCGPPQPYNKTYTNLETNQTVSVETVEKVNEIGILFNYEIRHASDVSWEDSDTGEGEEEDEGFFDKATDFFGGLFGGDDEEEAVAEEGTSESPTKGGGNALLQLEQQMVSETWKEFLDDGAMSWEANYDSGEWECQGYAIRDDVRQRELSVGMEGWGEDEDKEVEEEVIAEEVGVNENGDILDAVSPTFSGTKLLGLTHLPLDYVNFNGCSIPASTCTAIVGQVSAAYTGTNEYGVTQTVIQHLKDGMESGAFIPDGSLALNVEFTAAGGTAPSGGAGAIITLNTDRGMELQKEDEEESDLTKYGILFVCFVAILGAGFMAAMYVRGRKLQRRLREAKEEDIEYTAEEYEANLAMQETAMMNVEDGMLETGKTYPEEESHDTPIAFPLGTAQAQHGANEEPEQPTLMEQVELDFNPPPLDSPASGEVEISLTGSKSWAKE